MPRTSLFPMCCCIKIGHKSKKKERKLSHVAIFDRNQRPTIPKLMVNGRIAMGNQRRVSTAHEPIVIEMTEDFTTARTSRDYYDSSISMKQLFQVIPIENGFTNTPRSDYGDTDESANRYPKRPLIVGRRDPRIQHGPNFTAIDQNPCCSSSSPAQALDPEHLVHRQHVQWTYIDQDSIVSPLANNISSETRSISVATISGRNNLILPQPPVEANTASRCLAFLPQMLIAIISISLAWLANLLSFVLR